VDRDLLYNKPKKEVSGMANDYSSSVTRRAALQISGVTLLGLNQIELLQAQNKQAEPPSDSLIEQKARDITALPLNSDGSAKLFSEAELTPVADIGALYRNTGGKAPDIEYDPAKVRIRIRGNVMKKAGGLGLADLKKLPFTTQITRLQCGAPKPSGIVKWGGVRFADVCRNTSCSCLPTNMSLSKTSASPRIPRPCLSGRWTAHRCRPSTEHPTGW
jgi:DMSO/TMAO reductase YedYZ molybdopterin-dependent catalytic subunit